MNYILILSFASFNKGFIPTFPSPNGEGYWHFCSRCEIKVCIFKVLSAGSFSKQSRSTHGAALENQAGCVEGPKL